jgi:ATP-binding protein involved in chromosome partitioning
MPATLELIDAALARVEDPEIRRPITEIGMVKSRAIDAAGVATVAVWLTVAGCPMRDTITSRIKDAVGAVPGVIEVVVELDVMDEAQPLSSGTTRRKSSSPSPAI